MTGISATNVGAVSFDILSNSGAFTKQVKLAGNSAQNIMGGAMKKVGAAVAAAFSVKVVTAFAKECIELGSDLAEVQNVVDVTFGDSAPKINAWAKTTANAFGISELHAKQFSGTMGAMLKSMGLSKDSALDMSTSLVELSGDMASFYNLDVQTAFDKIRSGISGETEPLKQLGINMSVANLEAYALSQGITQSYNSMTQANQALLRYNYLMSVTADAQGDFSRTSNSWANQTRILTLQFESFKATVGSLIIGVLTPLLSILNDIMSTANKAAASISAIFGAESGASTAITGTGNAAAVAADSIANTGNAATTAAKKIKGAFTSFDEINTLSLGVSNSGSGSAVTGAGAAASSQITQTVESASKASSGIMLSFFDPMVEAWKAKGKPLLNSISFAFGSLKELFSEIGQSFADVWTNGTAETTLSYILSILTNIFNIIGSISSAFAKAWSGGNGGAIIQNLADSFNNLLYLADQIGISISDWWNSEAGQSFANSIVGMFGKISASSNVVTQSLREIWENGGNQTFTTLLSVLSNIISVITTIIGFASEIRAEIVEALGPQIANVLNGINFGLTGINDLLIWLQTDGEPILKGVAYAVTILSAAFTAYKSVQIASKVATTAFTVAQKLLNAAMSANPVGLVVAGVTALISVIAICVTHFDQIKAAGSKAWSSLTSGATQAWSGIKNTFSSVSTFFQNTFSNAWTKVKNVFSTGGQVFSGIKDGIIASFKKVVNSLITGINTIVKKPFEGLNKILNTIQSLKILNVQVFKWLTWRAPIPQLPMLAEGGWVAANNPQLAIVGDNKREGEIIAPESKITEAVERARNIARDVKLMIEVVVNYPDGKRIIKQINQAQLEEGRILLEV